MANTFTVNGSATLTTDGARSVGTLANNITLSGSNGVFQSQNVNSASWSALDTGSLIDLRMGWFFNTDLTASVTVATGSGGQNTLFTLWPDDSIVVSWSGSNPTLYAKSAGNSPVVLQYILTES